MSLLVAWELDWTTFKGHFLHKMFCDSDFHNFPVALSKESETYYQNLNKKNRHSKQFYLSNYCASILVKVEQKPDKYSLLTSLLFNLSVCNLFALFSYSLLVFSFLFIFFWLELIFVLLLFCFVFLCFLLPVGLEFIFISLF